MPALAFGSGPDPSADGPHFEKVDWKRDRGLRKLYFYAMILCMASATTGYDG